MPPVAIQGCTDPNAANYSVWATVDDGSCVYAEGVGICNGTCSGSGADLEALLEQYYGNVFYDRIYKIRVSPVV